MEPIFSSQPALPGLPVLPPRRLRWIATGLRGLLWAVVGAWLLFGLTWFVLHGWIVPRIAELRPQLEGMASRALGVPVRIGWISAESSGAIPVFALHGVTLLDAGGQPAVRLKRVVGSVSPTSLWNRGFAQLVIEQPELDIRRNADGSILVGGLSLSSGGGSHDSAALDWLFAQTEVVVRGGTVRWTDAMRQAPPLALHQVDAVLRNRRFRHWMRLDATPPADWGGRFSLRGIFRQPLLSRRAGDVAAWSGQAFGDFPRLDVSQLQHYARLDAPGLALLQGRGAVRGWLDVAGGAATGVLADLSLEAVEARLGPGLEPLAVAALTGRVGASRSPGGFEIDTDGLQFQLQDGLAWPGGKLALVHTRASGTAPQATVLRADRLDLAALAHIASRLPLASDLQTTIASLAPAGAVDSLNLRWQGPQDAPGSFAAKGRVTGLQLAGSTAGALPAAAGGASAAALPQPAMPGRPGLSGADIDFDFDQNGGRAGLKIVRGALVLPGIFEEARLPLDQLSTEVQWKRAGERLEVQLRNLQFANADAQGQAQVRWRTGNAAAAGGRFPGILDLQGSLSRGDGSRVHRYLPLLLDTEVRHYVRDAVVQGQVSEVKFKVKGPLDKLPFENPADGDFQVLARVRSGQFNYVPKSLQPTGTLPWPALTDLSGELLFSRSSLEVKVASGRVAGLPGLQLLRGDARIPDLAHNPTVAVTLEMRGLLADALGFVNTSPVGEMTERVLARASAAGTADYRFRLSLPIQNIDQSKVEGRIVLPGNDVRMLPQAPLLAGLKGRLDLTEQGFTVTGAQAGLLGGDIRIDGGTRPAAAGETRPGVVFKAQGRLTADGLRQAVDLGQAAQLARHATGSAAYSATLGFRRGVPEITLNSTLQGMALALPAPFGKSADAALPVHVDNTLLPGAQEAGKPLQDMLSLTLGRLAAAQYVRDLSGPEPRVLRGAIGIGLDAGDMPPAPDSGVAANVRLPQLDLDAWEKILGSAAGSNPSASATAAATPPAQPAADAGYLPNRLAIRAGELKLQGRSLNHVVVGASRDGPDWRATVDAAELDGYLEFRQPGSPGAGRVYARLSRLRLAASQASEVEALLDAQPASVPALDIVVDDLELDGRKLGRVEIEAVNRGATADGNPREWRLNRFAITTPEAALSATGNWTALAAGPGVPRSVYEGRRATMDFRLDVADSGELLRRFGMAGVIRRGKGRLEGQIGWNGSPLSLDYPSLDGRFNVSVAAGQFMKADPGIAKLLGVLSLQSLPRRLTLDFRDVFSQGFAFDFVRGDVTIADGVARTNNLQMGGVNAAVLMDGQADIEDETQQLRVVVVPEVNAGTASLIATAINPALGLGSFLAQMFLRRPLMEAATQEFQIDGTWSDPTITKVDRRARAKAQAGNSSTEQR